MTMNCLNCIRLKTLGLRCLNYTVMCYLIPWYFPVRVMVGVRLRVRFTVSVRVRVRVRV